MGEMIQEILSFSADGSYPEVRVKEKNKYVAMFLLEDYASNNSELAAIHQYLYQSFILKGQGLEELAELSRGICAVELKHLEILAELIIKLGEDPKFKCLLFNDKYFTTAGIQYSRKPKSMIGADINTKKKAISQYSEHIDQIDDPYVKMVLERIVKDEEHHLKLLNTAIKRLDNEAY